MSLRVFLFGLVGVGWVLSANVGEKNSRLRRVEVHVIVFDKSYLAHYFTLFSTLYIIDTSATNSMKRTSFASSSSLMQGEKTILVVSLASTLLIANNIGRPTKHSKASSACEISHTASIIDQSF